MTQSIVKKSRKSKSKETFPIDFTDPSNYGRYKPRRGGDGSLIILGAGGVGSNIAQNMHGSNNYFSLVDVFRSWTSGGFSHLVIIDDDTVNYHNGNRTAAFSIESCGNPKVETVRSHLGGGTFYNASYMAFTTVSICQKVTAENVVFSPPAGVLNLQPDTPIDVARGVNGTNLMIDCRDTMDPDMMLRQAYVKLSYDGGSVIGFTWFPAVVAKTVINFGAGDNSYAVTPSFYVPAALLGVLIFWLQGISVFKNLVPERHACSCNFDIGQVVNVVSFTINEEV